jgi:hypothetical protein
MLHDYGLIWSIYNYYHSSISLLIYSFEFSYLLIIFGKDSIIKC